MSELGLFWSTNHWFIIDSAGDLSIYSAFPLSFLGDILLWSLGPWYKSTTDFICPAESSNAYLSDFAGHHGLLPQLRLVGLDHPGNCSLINHPHQALPLLNPCNLQRLTGREETGPCWFVSGTWKRYLAQNETICTVLKWGHSLLWAEAMGTWSFWESSGCHVWKWII